MSKFDTRNINCVSNCVKKSELLLNPNTLSLVKNNKDYSICSTLNNEENKCTDNMDINKLQKFMTLPYLNLDLDFLLLNVFSIDDVDELINSINDLIKKKEPYEYVNRILNIWIKKNLNIMKNKNKILVNEYFKIAKIYWNINNDEKKLKKKIEIFIKQWFLKKKSGDFNINLGNDLKKELQK